ncbi:MULTISPECIES: XRE family transcriptional regulator [unclassified Sulfitobacter]|uniref:XRE family transcriptional regulator n=1 Tax=unclassified Sulfitobacter TaxID=196795 RepID=UPI0023E2B5D8|nr:MULTISPECIES: XRE family transcriptional regulator [unclassified Sulfitobacter]MDF3413264.1 XRE family transcriptional regulator [Sulfitobacter sp. KE5]MDF3492398.1 XRE family transcriptional regulator [Sulfitobacter sp. M51]MDF3500209.1 XRE family transcriptional regulator [Sulfitobacter sp. Ks17]MDF3527506.1 XRE family transcriptional regulator [Sulfitobacter sp. M77]MDF3523604.1 XRE family transcriptional regulator [Sulfitobacter sp. S66]
MDKFLEEVREYAERCGRQPGTVIQKMVGLSGTTWEKWASGQSFPRADTIDRIRAHIAANPAPTEAGSKGDAE